MQWLQFAWTGRAGGQMRREMKGVGHTRHTPPRPPARPPLQVIMSAQLRPHSLHRIPRRKKRPTSRLPLQTLASAIRSETAESGAGGTHCLHLLALNPPTVRPSPSPSASFRYQMASIIIYDYGYGKIIGTVDCRLVPQETD